MLSFTAFGVPISYLPATRFPPTERDYSIMSYQELNNILLLFSGTFHDGTMTNELWIFSLLGNYWSESVSASTSLPRIL